ncbi:hypothetical protein KKH39_02495 [Patescibacteria group bacterium]|nr:hypothetical protein [Patescibacteria group bacterium]
MFKYSTRTKIFLILALVSLVVLLSVITLYLNSKSRDLEFVSQLRQLGNGLEIYYDQYNAYPTLAKSEVSLIQGISENGINVAGDEIYFRQSFDWIRSATLASNGENYIIEFELDNSWDTWQIDSRNGGQCRIGNNLVMRCVDK